MSLRFLLLSLFLAFFNLSSGQENEDNSFLAKSFFSHDIRNRGLPGFVQGQEDKAILDFSEHNSKFYEKSKVDSLKIKNVFISFQSNDTLKNQIRELKKFPELEFLEIKTGLSIGRNKEIEELVIPSEIGQLKNLKYLQISGSFEIDLQSLFEELKNLSRLKYLGLSHVNDELKIPENITGLKNLEGLKLLGYTNISFPDGIQEMNQLNTLFLEPQNIKKDIGLLAKSTFPRINYLKLYYTNLNRENLTAIDKLDKLESLELVNCNIDRIADLMDVLPSSLKKIKWTSLKTDTTEISFEKFNNLEVLELDGIISYEITPFAYELNNLKSLTIHSEKLESINLSSAQNLQILDLGYSNLSEMPGGLEELQDLRILKLNENHISEIPRDISSLKNLEELDLAKNRVAKIAVGIGELRKLEKFNLAFNQLEKLPNDFTQLKNLRDLNLNANKLKGLPSDFGELKNLVNLNLGDNYLQSLPGSITQLRELKIFNISYNDIEALPEDIGNMIALEDFILGGNKGQEISYVSITENSDFNKNRKREFNRIRKIPESFSKLANIKRLYFKDLSTLDSENLFQILLKLPSKKYRTELRGVGVHNLPDVGWENFLGETLELGGSVIDSIPEQILKAPYLEKISFSLSEADRLSYSFNNSEDFLVFAEDFGYVEFEDIKRSESMASAYLDYAYAKKYKSDKKNIIEIFNKAFILDSAYTAENIRPADYARALRENKEYEKAITYYDKAIYQDTIRGPYILNYIIPHFKERAELQLKVGDSLDALEGLEYFSGRFDKSSWTSTGLLAKKLGKDDLARRYFTNAKEYYRKKIEQSRESDRINYLEQLSLLEVFYISEDFEEASNYMDELMKFEFIANDELVIRRLFKIVDSILQDTVDNDYLVSFKEYLDSNRTDLQRWSFDLFEDWLAMTNSLSSEKKTMIFTALKEL
ncbi:hypothetical protein ML462_05815 [Gramella lutea]|uniref:Disease resistance R13L4/SHOC-2-like LRR domain-containing protein n=1 Tax=Christiangramia lutea TaxID=1607951 RepID=A0A9X2A8U0_9FLAO|nr:hypothetical protein [Christiangramia lutea]MCH4822685.1 hypothetical protein [Christiangramia lutea]